MIQVVAIIHSKDKDWILLQRQRWRSTMMTSSSGNIFRVTGPLWGESTGHPLSLDLHTRIGDTILSGGRVLCFLLINLTTWPRSPSIANQHARRLRTNQWHRRHHIVTSSLPNSAWQLSYFWHKMSVILLTIFWNTMSSKNCFSFGSHIPEICSGNCRRRAIIWSIDRPVYWWIYVLPCPIYCMYVFILQPPVVLISTTNNTAGWWEVQIRPLSTATIPGNPGSCAVRGVPGRATGAIAQQVGTGG